MDKSVTMSNSSNSSSYDKTLGEEFALSFLNDTYILIDKIGIGSFSSVWLALNIKNLNLYAIKILSIDEYDSGIKEIKILNEISLNKCKYLSVIIEHFEVPNPIIENSINLCIVMDLYIGSVYQLLKIKYEDGFPPSIVNKIILNTLLGLKELHNLGYIHTDIKPENILVKGLNPIFYKFKEYVISNTKVNKLINNIKNKNNFINSLSCYNNNKINNLIKILIKKFKLICNEYTTSEYYDDNDHILIPNYYDKEFTLLINDDLNTLEYVLSDFGTIKYISNNNDEEIQTRYYRCPEVLLGCKWNESVDLWSIGCTYFELLTNMLIFDPEKFNGSTTDEQHLIEIAQFIVLDANQYESGKYYNKFPNNEKVIYSIKESIKYCKPNIDDKDLLFCTIFIKSVISNPNNRKSIDYLINMIINKNN